MLALIAMMAAATAAPATNAGQLEVTAVPAEILIETGDTQQLNFDFLVTNTSGSPLELTSIEMTVVDANGRPLLRRDADGSGASPAIETVLPDRKFAAGGKGVFFNPFTTFARGFPLNELRYKLTFKDGDTTIVRDIAVRPKAWQPANPLILPVADRLWVKHGHDYLSHHRRWNPLHPIAQSFGATATFARYGLDLMVVDAEGRTRKTGAKRNDDFLGWGAPVRAPAAGTVVAAFDKDADDDLATGKTGFDPERLAKEPLHFYGNYVIIDHGHGEFSMLGHLQHGSAAVKAGDKVEQGQPVARMGTSGSAEFEPHLHYELRRGTTMAVEGLPAYFVNFVRATSGRAVQQGPINSGDFVSPAR